LRLQYDQTALPYGGWDTCPSQLICLELGNRDTCATLHPSLVQTTPELPKDSHLGGSTPSPTATQSGPSAHPALLGTTCTLASIPAWHLLPTRSSVPLDEEEASQDALRKHILVLRDQPFPVRIQLLVLLVCGRQSSLNSIHMYHGPGLSLVFFTLTAETNVVLQSYWDSALGSRDASTT
jgi:hypothetical protein